MTSTERGEEVWFVRHAGLVAAILATLFPLGLILARQIVTGTHYYRFLYWNFFLAWIPLVAALLARRSARRDSWWTIPFLLLWILFLPNAPYLVSDLMHLRWGSGRYAPHWYDAAMLGATAMAGIGLAVGSLEVARQAVAWRWGRGASALIVVIASYLAGFGVYVGRFLRWNSWDVVSDPPALADDLMRRLSESSSLPRAIGLTAIVGSFLLVAYICALLLRSAVRREGHHT